MKESFLEDGHVTRDQGADQNDLNVAHAMVIFVGDRGRDTSLQVRRVELTVFKKAVSCSPQQNSLPRRFSWKFSSLQLRSFFLPGSTLPSLAEVGGAG